MRLGLMNNPRRPLAEEVAVIAELEFDFVDLTLEPPGAWPADAKEIRRLLDAHGLAAVGHTAWYLPIVSPFPELEREARSLFRRACELFAEIGITLVNVHPIASIFGREEAVARNAEAIGALADDAAELGVTIMVENLGGSFYAPEDLAPILEAVPEAGFHLDVGHANLGVAPGEPNRAPALIEAFGDRLAHVHVSDNLGKDDLHLPLGAGTIDWPEIVGSLKTAGWDDLVTVEVFSPEREHAKTSRRLWLEWWQASG
jgi:sugar phosphate isomerase/epimerase